MPDVHRPVVTRTRSELDSVLTRARERGAAVVLVPTMGALHEGHVALIRAAHRVHPDPTVVVSVFVNPLQFGPGEDLARYPRSLDADVAICADEGVDVVFAPDVTEIYPEEPEVTVDPGPLGDSLEGAVRPTHFRGVLTVVAKLFAMVRPDSALFGEKDYQQLVLVRKMTRDLALAVDIVAVPTVREPDGLALSSRNRYLDAEQHGLATALSLALRAGADAGAAGAAAALSATRAVLASSPGVAVDYVELTSPDLSPPPAQGEARLMVAGRVGSVRLIDNTAILLGSQDRRAALGAGDSESAG